MDVTVSHNLTYTMTITHLTKRSSAYFFSYRKRIDQSGPETEIFYFSHERSTNTWLQYGTMESFGQFLTKNRALPVLT